MNYTLFAILQKGEQIDYIFSGELEIKMEKDELNIWANGELCASIINVKLFLLCKN